MIRLKPERLIRMATSFSGVYHACRGLNLDAPNRRRSCDEHVILITKTAAVKMFSYAI
jgi:hypothetical protein